MRIMHIGSVVVAVAVCANSVALCFPAVFSPWALPSALAPETEWAILVLPEEDMTVEHPVVFVYHQEMLQATQLNKDFRKTFTACAAIRVDGLAGNEKLASPASQSPSLSANCLSPFGGALLRI